MEKEMPIHTQEEVEQKEISLDETEGWEVFLDHATEAYDELAEAAGFHEHDEAVQAILQSGVQAYEELQLLAENSIEKIENKEGISYQDSDRAQELYNTITSARDEIEALQNATEPFEEHNQPEGQEVKLESAFEAETNSESLNIEVLNTQGSVSSVETKTQEVEVKFERQAEVDKKYIEKLNEAYKKLLLVESGIQKTIVKYKSLVEGLGKDKVTAERFAFMQLEATHTRARALKKELESGEVEATEVAAENAENEVLEIEKNLAQIEKGLSKFFAESEIKQNLGPMKVQAEHDIKPVSISTPKVVEEKLVDSAGMPQKIKPPLSSLRSDEKVFSDSESLLPVSLKNDSYYKTFLREHSITWQQVERALRKGISEVEKASKFDSVLGIKQDSTFANFLSEMTIKELSDFESLSWEQKNAELAALSKEKDVQIDYTTYKKWLVKFDLMVEIVPLEPDMTFAELCAIYEIINLLPEEVV